MDIFERGSNSGDSKDKVIRCKFYSIFSLLAKVKTIKKKTISISLYSAKIEPYVYLLGYLPGLKNINIIQNFFVGACAMSIAMSILGPLFFLLCINDLPNVSEKLFAILFADDTSVFLEGKDLAEITNTLNAELAKLTVWLSANKLTLNTSKSHFMIFHRAELKSSDTKIPVILSNTILEQVTFIKFL